MHVNGCLLPPTQFCFPGCSTSSYTVVDESLTADINQSGLVLACAARRYSLLPESVHDFGSFGLHFFLVSAENGQGAEYAVVTRYLSHTHTTASHSNVPANCIDCSHQHGLQHDLANVMSQGGLRGGGGSTLLQGLKALLEESTVDTSEQSLYDELCDLVERKPKNFASSIKGFGQ